MTFPFKTAFAAVCIVAASFGGVKAFYVANQSETDLLLAENVEALSSGEGDDDGMVKNGYIYKVNPTFGKTCWHHFVDPAKYEVREGYDEVTKKKYKYKVYYNGYETYKSKACIQYEIKSKLYFDFWNDCNTPQVAKCKDGDLDKQPSILSWYE